VKSSTFKFKDPEGVEIFTYKWLSEKTPKAVVQIVHGMAEHAERYARFAQALTDAGYNVYADDHRGHGKTALAVDRQGYIGETDGFNWMVKDENQLTEIIKKENPNLPIFLFGHSMGSFISQGYIARYGANLKGCILSGTAGNQGPLLLIARMLAAGEMKKGPHLPCPKLNKLSFGSFNDKFKPNRTEFDWLSRDEAEVDKYINDPYCGVLFPASFFYFFTDFLINLHKPQMLGGIPQDLPVYIYAGANDPVGKSGKLVVSLYKLYQKLGIKDLAMKLYPDARHETLNEINRDEVTKDVINWLNKHI
jgi:alpha-beta hydrolase superfamily lysophospholipase